MAHKVIIRENQLDEKAFPETWHPLIKKIYASRISTINEVNKSLKQLLPPDGLTDINQACLSILSAIKKQRNIVIYGDYDVDGATSTALLFRALKALNAQVSYFIPNRWKHGYGLSVKGIEALPGKPDLVITVDNGIRSFEAANFLQSQGIELIITDHHEVHHQLPEASAIVNPKRSDSHFPSKNLAGVGVVFYLLICLKQLYENSGKTFSFNLSHHLDLVALGTIADLVPLDYNNRILVQMGLSVIKQQKGNLGIQALCEHAAIDNQKIRSVDISFAIAPRLNAVGRLDDMSEGVALLVTDDWATAQEYAKLLDGYNRDRKAIENEMIRQAEEHINSQLPLIFAYQKDWHEGVIGIVASRLKFRFQRPALVATDTEDKQKIKASLRSVSGIDIHELLNEAAREFPADVLQFGGHAMAAGLSIEKPYYVQFCEILCQKYQQLNCHERNHQAIACDGKLPADLFQIDWARYLEQLEPWGAGFPKPSFYNQFIVQDCRKLGAHHTKLTLKEYHSGKTMAATWFFNQVDYSYGCKIAAVYQLDINRFYGDERLQLLIQDIHINGRELL